MGRKPLTEEERKKRRSERNAKYYQEHRDILLERAKENASFLTREERRAITHPKWLTEIQEASHNSILPFLIGIEELNLSEKLYPSEMRVLEELVVLISAHIEKKRYE
jgi:hypothetical protein